MSEPQNARFSLQGEYLYQVLRDIQTRPGMFLGNQSITRLRAFLDGYSSARADLGLPTTQQEKAFNGFQAWIQAHFKITATQGWDRIILAHSTNEQDALDRFFELFAQFQQETRSISESSHSPTQIAS
ncbi:hypothetical protein ACQ4M3_38405 [Leptolyngbya sp. AN03gr2]|uniref:hypothetical protein n=1 Tax=unclassified Leptolyngbya TaxID=2650499 RepID=UPI003D31CB15